MSYFVVSVALLSARSYLTPQVVRRLVRWLRDQGGVGRMLAAEGCPWLTDAPLHVLRGLLAVPASVARCATPADLRSFLTARASALGSQPLACYGGRPEAVATLLRWCLLDLDADDAKTLHGLPLVLTCDGVLGAVGTVQALVPSDRRLAFLFRGASGRLLYPNLAAVFNEWSHVAALAAVGLMPLSWETLATCLDRILPAALRTNTLVLAPPNCPPLAFFVDLCQYILAQPPAPAHGAMSSWALLPVLCAASSNVPNAFVPLSLSSSVLGLSASPAALDPLSELLVRLGLPHAAAALPGLTLATVSPTLLLRTRLPLQWDRASGADRRYLLSLLEACVPDPASPAAALLPSQLSAADLTALSHLPLFELEGEIPVFVALDGRPPRMLPEGVTLPGAFFRSAAQLCPRLYAALGIKPLSVAEMYTQHILPTFDQCSPEERRGHMERLAKLMETLGSDSSAVIAAASKLTGLGCSSTDGVQVARAGFPPPMVACGRWLT